MSTGECFPNALKIYCTFANRTITAPALNTQLSLSTIYGYPDSTLRTKFYVKRHLVVYYVKNRHYLFIYSTQHIGYLPFGVSCAV